MESFEIPCGCSASLSVVAGQAGERIRCPACGGELRVPRLGELRRLGRSAHGMSAHAAQGARAGDGLGRDAGPRGPLTGRRWSFGHACMLAGGVVAVSAALAAARFGTAPGPQSVNERGIREMVAATDFETVLRAWKAFEQMGPQAGPPDWERRYQATTTIARLLWVVAGAGAVLATVGGALILAGGSRPHAGAS
jgi:hypothetical protein